MSVDMVSYLEGCRVAVDGFLEARLPPAGPDGMGRLGAAMRHAVLSGGKRLRPALVLAACEAVGSARERALPGAGAVELVHAYSLVHDDLPAMDDDVERRGRPTVHVAFDEATAILAGDALLTLAFQVLSTPGEVAPIRQLAAVQELAVSAGHAGLVGGQSLDMSYAGKEVESLEVLERIHLGKTAALFRVSAAVGGHLGEAGPEEQEALAEYGEALGLAFQHADDILDSEHRHLSSAAAARLAELLSMARERAALFGEAGLPLGGLADLVESYPRKGAV